MQAEDNYAAEMPPKFYRAKIDHDGIYWGVEEVPSLADGDFPVPADCDLRPGAYRFIAAVDGKPAHFAPIEPLHIKKAEGAPTLEQAFHALVTGGIASPRVAAWVAEFEKTIDGSKG